ncbi:MAG TPA: hypothetical protein VLG68_02615 [Gammaproteobacteria bacterium]|nr:hypothetical protein [Gammaproteobacteria bacterium]
MLRTLVWIIGFLLLTAVLMFFTVRPLEAAACPRCFGLTELASGVYGETGLSDEARQHTLQTVAAAEERVGRFYGGLQHVPRVLACATPGCYRRIGGSGTRVGSVGTFTLMVSPEGMDVVLISHELSHVELHGRVGVLHMSAGAVPAWFDEGVAVLVSDDPVYLAPPRKGMADRCTSGPTPDMPVEPGEWRDALQQEGEVMYARAACQVDLWMISKGGPAAVPALLAKVAGGEDFDAVYK